MTLQATTSRVRSVLISGLFFLSGISGLAYEVLWFKQFSHVWGSSHVAMASVVSAFLLGLGIGAYAFGRIGTYLGRTLFWYGVCEIGIGLLAVQIPWETSLLWEFSTRQYGALREWTVMHFLVQCATTFLVIGPTCVLMGATFPLLVRHLAATSVPGHAVSWLYCVNSLGAATGCYLVGFHILPLLGLYWANLSIAVLSISVGLIAVASSSRINESAFKLPGDEGDLHASELEGLTIGSGLNRGYSLTAICLVGMITGVAALVLQTVWNRQLSLVLGSSTYAFSAMLFVVLLGLGLGSFLFRYLFTGHDDDLSVIISLTSATVVTTVLGMWLVPLAAECVGALSPLRGNHVTNAVICIVASGAVEFFPACMMGAIFPCLFQLSRGASSSPGRVVGTLYAFNTAGTLIGAMATSVWLMPHWGTHVTVALALVAYLVVMVTCSLISRPTAQAWIAMTIATVACCLFYAMPSNPVRTNCGLFLYGYSDLKSSPPKVVYFKEGASSNVMVTKQDGNVVLRVNGKVDGSNGVDMSMQLGLAYFPRFLNPNATEVLVIGHGTGTTSGASLLFPDTNVTCCEIERAMLGAADHFNESNHRPHQSKRFKFIFDDARAYIQGTSQKYDLILSEPSNPWIAGVSNLFTDQFYRIASDKLLTGGIFAQWIQTYSFAPEDYATVIRTVRDVFPYQRLIRISPADTILLASNEPLHREASTIVTSQRLVNSSPAIKTDLSRYFSTNNVAALLLTHLIMDERALNRFERRYSRAHRNTDSDSRLEFVAAQRVYQLGQRDVGRDLLTAAGAEWFGEHFRQLDGGIEQSSALHQLFIQFLDAGLVETAAALVHHEEIRRIESASLLADRMITMNHLDLDLLEKLLAIPDGSTAADCVRVGGALRMQNRFADAVTLFERLSERFPNASSIWTNLALNYAESGQLNRARAAHAKALNLDPTNTLSRQALRAFEDPTERWRRAN